MLATMAEDDDEEEGEEDRTGEIEMEQVFGSLRYLYFGWNSSLRRYSVVAPRSDELPCRAGETGRLQLQADIVA